MPVFGCVGPIGWVPEENHRARAQLGVHRVHLVDEELRLGGGGGSRQNHDSLPSALSMMTN